MRAYIYIKYQSTPWGTDPYREAIPNPIFWKITSCYIFPYKYWYGPPSTSNWTGGREPLGKSQVAICFRRNTCMKPPQEAIELLGTIASRGRFVLPSMKYVKQKINVVRTLMCGCRGGDRGFGPPPPPLKNHKNIGFLSNTGPDPLKKHKAPKPAVNIGPSSACQRNAI